jgi:REP-associated tyrosine transposase
VRTRRRFLLAGYVLMPDHWHAMIVPGQGDRIDRLMDSLKVAATRRINSYRQTRGGLWHARYFDRIVRTVKEFHETLDYMHLNPVRRGLVNHPAEWAWSSYHCFGGTQPARLEIDDLNLPVDQDRSSVLRLFNSLATPKEVEKPQRRRAGVAVPQDP